jgi:hypothetical protein
MGGKKAVYTHFLKSLTQLTTELPTDNDARPSVMFAASPDSNSFQHWSDRVAMMLVQTAHIRTQETEFISAQPRWDFRQMSKPQSSCCNMPQVAYVHILLGDTDPIDCGTDIHQNELA